MAKEVKRLGERSPAIAPTAAGEAASEPRKPRSLAAVRAEINPPGERAKLRDFVDQEITLLEGRYFEGEYGGACWLRIADKNGVVYEVVVGQKVVLATLLPVLEELPLTCTVRKIQRGKYGGYFTLE